MVNCRDCDNKKCSLFGTYYLPTDCTSFKEKGICIGYKCSNYGKCLIHDERFCILYIKENMCPTCIWFNNCGICYAPFCGYPPETSLRFHKCSYMRKKEKPPLGVMPENLWKEERIKQLVGAIEGRVDYCDFKKDYSEIKKWCFEIIKIIDSLRNNRIENKGAH